MIPHVGPGSQPGRIGRYRILERIGKGAMGMVYSAHDEIMDRVVAIKVMMADLEGEPDTRTRFYREAQAAGRLLHPNIITIFDMGEDEGRIYIVMELLKGFTLGEFLKRPGGVSIEEKVDVMVQVCEGLGAAHALGIFHRDIKPGNLFVLHDGTLKILDFGVARLATSTITASGFIIGTPDYMSPEQARGREIDQRSDIFSAAGVFYYMLCGRKPFAAPDLPAVLRKVQAEDPPPLPEQEAPAALTRIVLRSLSKDPALRHQRMADLASDLTRFRRSYEAETRQLAVIAHQRFGAIVDLVRQRQDLCQWLGLPVPDGVPPIARRLGDERPEFVAQQADGWMQVPFSRPQLAELAAGLCAEHQPLVNEVASLAGARASLEAVESALDEQRPDLAVGSLEGLPLAVAEAPRVRHLRDRCQAAIEQFQARHARVSSLQVDARAALAAGNWVVARALAEEALALDAQAAEALAVRARAVEALDREARERVRQQQRALERARRAVTERRLDVAEQELALARQADTPDDQLQPVERLLAEARRSVAAEAALARRAAEAIASARTSFREGRRDEAVAMLQACLDVEPAAPGVRRELDYLQAEIRRLTEAERRRSEAAAHAARAEAAVGARDFRTAVEAATQALALDPGNLDAARVHAMAQAALRAETATRDRQALVADRLSRARQLLQEGATQKALRDVQRVLDLDPAHVEALALLSEVSRIEAEQEAHRERERLERERRGAIEQDVRIARQALRVGALEAAEGAIARITVLDTTEPALAGLVAEAATLRARLEAIAREKDDDTVAMGSGSVDDDDTVAMAADPGADEPIMTRIGSRLKTMWSRRVPGAGGEDAGSGNRG